jgi:hypothetical protein
MRRIVLVVLALLMASGVAVAGSASAASTASTAQAVDTGRFAPVNRPGPALSVPPSVLAASLVCSPGVNRSATRPTVLLVPGTFLDPQTNYGKTWAVALAKAGRPYCMDTLGGATSADAQVAGETVVYAIRTIAQRTGRKVDVLGYSQGGLVPRFALRFFPDTRNLVDDLVMLDPSSHGTPDADALCLATCQAGVWQQRTKANYIAAVNSGQETFAPVSYTVLYTNTDEVVTPNLGFGSSPLASSALHTGTGAIRNIALQSICPTDLSEHLLVGSIDPVPYAVALDAFDHAGTASPARIPRSVCTQGTLPGVTPQASAAAFAQVGLVIGKNILTQPRVPAEPPLARYTLR